MIGNEDLGGIVTHWAQHSKFVEALVLIGSRARETQDTVWRADRQSDWDFHVITSSSRYFCDPSWLQGLTGAKLLVSAARITRLAQVQKVNAVFAGTEADFVIIPARLLWWWKIQIQLGLHRREGALRRRLQDLAIVIRPGWRFLKGGDKWESFYRQVVAQLPDRRLDDASVRALADVFICEYVWILQKLERGELLAAQRMLHRELAETNFQLLHEDRLRNNKRTFPEGRRLEMVAECELPIVSVNSLLSAESLKVAVEKAAAGMRDLVRRLVGDTWRWPI